MEAAQDEFEAQYHAVRRSAQLDDEWAEEPTVPMRAALAAHR